jgi:hypothetical protein
MFLRKYVEVRMVRHPRSQLQIHFTQQINILTSILNHCFPGLHIATHTPSPRLETTSIYFLTKTQVLPYMIQTIRVKHEIPASYF